jgi:hypothetical protein
MRSNTKGYGGKSHLTDSQNSDTIASSGRELYHLQFLLQMASPKLLDTPSCVVFSSGENLHLTRTTYLTVNFTKLCVYFFT